MNEVIRIVGECATRVWGLTGTERILRMLAAQGLPLQSDAPGATVLLLRADHIYDLRLLAAMARTGDAFQLCADPAGQVVAARVPQAQLESAAAELPSGSGPTLDALPRRMSSELVTGFENRLRKHEPPRVYNIAGADVHALETELFGGAYKGVTDLVTKWWWPVPAFHATHVCIRLGLRPNHVTLLGLLLTLLAAGAFAQGWFGAGLLMGWFMTFLDTVDGKVARVTVTASRFGDYLDHGIDLLHPPLWYAAWGMGVAAQWSGPVPVATAVWLMLFGYIGGRLCEGAFQLFAGSFSLFVWRPLDSINRLITARRNPNLILLTVFWLAGNPAAGLWAVVSWHLASTLFLLLRVLYAIGIRLRRGRLESWLANVDAERDRYPLAVRLFTRQPANSGPLRR
jgi:phosphatidylglycerophosphate synthase